jgi:hypothetical protein
MGLSSSKNKGADTSTALSSKSIKKAIRNKQLAPILEGRDDDPAGTLDECEHVAGGLAFKTQAAFPLHRVHSVRRCNGSLIGMSEAIAPCECTHFCATSGSTHPCRPHLPAALPSNKHSRLLRQLAVHRLLHPSECTLPYIPNVHYLNVSCELCLTSVPRG